MVQTKNGYETSYEDRKQNRLQVVYRRQTQERQIFMQDLKEIRRQREIRLFKTMKNLIGPTWLQALSVLQRKALDTLEFSIYQDLLEGRPTRTASLMKELGLYPRPNTVELMTCVYLGRNDPKEMLAQLFLTTYGHPIEGKRCYYNLNARLVLSGILYLGLENLLELLRLRFLPDKEKKPPKPKPRPQPQPQLESPYLQEMTAVLYLRPKRKPFRPAPLPNLDDLNDPYEEEPPIAKPPPPPPPRPPPKKRLPRSYCDKIAGVMNIEPYSTITTTHTIKTVTQGNQLRKTKGSKMSIALKKSYGISVSRSSRGDKRRKRLTAPNTGISSTQYTINGVSKVHGKKVFVLGNVSTLPPEGDLINGGFRLINGEYINIHCGFRGRPPPQKPGICDCVTNWQDAVFKYVKENKCRCGHLYDYGNEGIFPPEEIPYFQKPSRFSPFQFNYHTIYNLDEKQLFVEKKFKKIWDTDSTLHIGDSAVIEKKDKKKKKFRRSSATCLGQNPKPEDYLKCALRQMRRLNIAAKLPDIHLVPELKEWMRWRIYGPFTKSVKKDMLIKSFMFWQIYCGLEKKGLGHVYPKQDPKYKGLTTWKNKQDLNDKFRKYTLKYKLDLYRTYAYSTNILWPTMFQAEFPNKKFREIFFSYLFSRIEDLQLMHPYNSREAAERANILSKKRYICKPDGAEEKD
ncbi:uncharacterized protein LOC120637914 [Pararge aegeria]|uniref:Jg7724 protein n=1 Tax=Pararge aegeria aegeria TaxID=348720 RepID=A0A8S4RPG0_9NEOP|nr:uncharacterized protein LOC120637914 [Pararge aegeria]CAH2238790.1 jg7724 [Pararge aegeria aegeria]